MTDEQIIRLRVKHEVLESVLKQVYKYHDFSHPLVQYIYRELGPCTVEGYIEADKRYSDLIQEELLKDRNCL